MSRRCLGGVSEVSSVPLSAHRFGKVWLHALVDLVEVLLADALRDLVAYGQTGSGKAPARLPAVPLPRGISLAVLTDELDDRLDRLERLAVRVGKLEVRQLLAPRLWKGAERAPRRVSAPIQLLCATPSCSLSASPGTLPASPRPRRIQPARQSTPPLCSPSRRLGAARQWRRLRRRQQRRRRRPRPFRARPCDPPWARGGGHGSSAQRGRGRRAGAGASRCGGDQRQEASPGSWAPRRQVRLFTAHESR